MEETQTPELVKPIISKPSSGHEKHCFVVMPYGRDASEIKWFKGWYEVVIKPAVIKAGLLPILAAAEEQPGAINDEIRAHLTYDPMVVIDLGGEDAEDEPNPNVMYELGIRHALGLPHVMMAWKGQRLPFDVGNQRVIMENRDFVDIEINRTRLVTFIAAAENGKYYRPMEAVSRIATIEAASVSLGEDQILGALVKEVKDLRTTFAAASFHRSSFQRPSQPLTVRRLMKNKLLRKDLYQYYLSIGGNGKEWPKVLKVVPTQTIIEQSPNWTIDNWKQYITERAKDISSSIAPQGPTGELLVREENDKADATDQSSPITDEIIDRVKQRLPSQPWSVGVHKQIAIDLGLSNNTVQKCIRKLIERKIFEPQANGQLLEEKLNGNA